MDHVTSVISPYIPESEYERKLPLRTTRAATNNSNDVFFATYSSQQIVDFYLRQAEACWPGIENLIKYALQDEHDLILEGWHILPHLIRTVITPQNQGVMKVLFLYKSDTEDIVAGLKVGQVKNDWVLKNTKNESTFPAVAKMLSEFGKHFEAESKKYNLQAINMDFDFEQKLACSLEVLL